MPKKDYTHLTKEELIAKINALEKRKKYGLVWEDKPEDVVELCKTKLPVLKEVKSKAIVDDKDKPVNLLIEGDNYHALSVLNYTHEGKIDIIYIDPPYNTGAQDWKYNNHYVDITDGWRHSKWISFMRNRLILCKSLLSKDGIMIIAIDDNELCALGVLLDEIFPYKVRNTVVIVNNPHGVSRSGFSRCHEYAFFLINPNRDINKKAVPEDTREINLRRSGNNSLRKDSPTMFYPIFVKKNNLKIIGAGEVPKDDYHPKQRVIDRKEYYEIWPIDKKQIEKNWYYSRKRVIEEGGKELFCKWVKDELNVYFHHSNNSEQTYKSVWTGSEYDAGAYGATLVKTMLNNNFPFPKSIHTLRDCLKAVIKKEDSTILDFFAGSGTTGHAVLELNKEKNYNCKFILCTNNENGIARDICYPRIVKAIKGYVVPNGNKIDVLGGNVKYYMTDFVDAGPTDRNKKKLTEQAVEMLCVKESTFESVVEKKKYTIYKAGKHYTGIIFDQEVIDNFKENIKSMKGDFSIYIFSLGDDSFEEEFADLKQKVKVKPIPESIMRVYRRIFK